MQVQQLINYSLLVIVQCLNGRGNCIYLIIIIYYLHSHSLAETEMICVSVVDGRDTVRWACGDHNSLQRLTHASNLIHNFKVAPYLIAVAISPDTSKGHTSLDISRSKRPKTLLDLLTGPRSVKYRAKKWNIHRILSMMM